MQYRGRSIGTEPPHVYAVGTFFKSKKLQLVHSF